MKLRYTMFMLRDDGEVICEAALIHLNGRPMLNEFSFY